ncbi:MAG: hypothetical protein CL610_04950 [Anaerolineaceae bacterium]|nr:hypothetical protein [Anaerolineaceae bacterium]
MGFLRRRDSGNPNLLVGIFLLILLSVFMGPNVMPRLISSVTPIIDEAIPCEWLRYGVDRANHQSLIGRASDNALGLEVRTSPVPSDQNGVLSIEVVVINQSLGTIPIIYSPNQFNIGDDGSSGLGIIFEPGNLQAASSGRSDAQSFSEQNIRLLGPRQRCIHNINIPVSQLDQTIRQGGGSVKAFYRINGAGAIVQAAAGPTPIYPDQGLDVIGGGYVESLVMPIDVLVSAQ